jgi:hypothetical protein
VIRFSAVLEFALEEIDGGIVSTEPGLVTQEAVNFIRQDELLEVDALFPQSGDECDRLAEVHVAIVVAVY